MTDLRPEDALAHAAGALRRLGKPFALVGGLAVSVRGEVRTTRDVDLAVAVGAVPVAIAEDLIAMKLLAARAGRARGWDDALGLLQINPGLDLELVRERLGLIAARGFARNQDLLSKLDALLSEHAGG